MKLVQLILIGLIVISCVYSKEKLDKKFRSKSHHTQSYENVSSKIGDNYGPVDRVQHISETFYGGNPNTLPMDRHFLWKDYHKNQFQRPFFHGVVGPQFRVPFTEETSPYKHISSPVPRGDYSTRIVPHDIPPNTHSHTSWDMPKRQDVVQIDIPNSSTHTAEMHTDPRFPPKGPVGIVTGTVYHNTGSVSEEVNHGNNMEPTAKNHQTGNSEFSFAEKKKRSLSKVKLHGKSKVHKKSKGEPLHNADVAQVKTASINEAQSAEATSSKLLDAMTPHPEMNDGTMVLGITVKNKEDLDLEVHEENNALKNTLAYWHDRPQGIRSRHTKPFLPPKTRRRRL